MDDRVMALCELSGDLLFAKIPKDRLAYYVDASLAAGRRAAKDLTGRDIFELYREADISIDYREAGKGSFGVVLRGQATMGEKECRVELYRDSIRQLAENSAWEGIPALDYDTALAVHLAHEYFHYLEYKRLGFVAESLDSIVTFQLGKWGRTARVQRCGEIPAHAFAKELLALPCLPNLYDYSYLIRSGRLSREAFDGKIEAMGRMLTAHP